MTGRRWKPKRNQQIEFLQLMRKIADGYEPDDPQSVGDDLFTIPTHVFWMLFSLAEKAPLPRGAPRTVGPRLSWRDPSKSPTEMLVTAALHRKKELVAKGMSATEAHWQAAKELGYDSEEEDPNADLSELTAIGMGVGKKQKRPRLPGGHRSAKTISTAMGKTKYRR